MPTQEEIHAQVLASLRSAPRPNKQRDAETGISERKLALSLYIWERSIASCRPPVKREDGVEVRIRPCRLEDGKDFLRFDPQTGKFRKDNPFGMDEAGGADAKVQKDCIWLCNHDVLLNGTQMRIVGLEYDKNAVVLFSTTAVEWAIAKEKDEKVKAYMKGEMTKILQHKVRPAYKRML